MFFFLSKLEKLWGQYDYICFNKKKKKKRGLVWIFPLFNDISAFADY